MSKSVAEILSILEHATKLGDKPNEAKKALDKLFEPLGYDFQEVDEDEDPSNNDAVKVIDGLTALVQAQKAGKKGLFVKNPELAEKRLEALAKLRNWLSKARPKNSAFFDQVNLNRLGIQLGLRVLKPRAINQADYGFCGPVTILYPLNKADPAKYVDYVLDLAEKGVGRLGSTEIDVRNSSALLRNYKRDKIPEVDYVGLASLRTAVDVAMPMAPLLDVADPDSESHATAPEQMVRALQWAGYHPVEDKTLNDYKALPRDQNRLQTAYDRLEECAQLLKIKPAYAVIALVQSILARAAKRGADITALPQGLRLADLHWNIVKNIVITNSSRSAPLTGSVSMKVVTWKWSGTKVYNMADYLPRFFGYLAADPSATSSKALLKDCTPKQ
jgi:hypothetical protein